MFSTPRSKFLKRIYKKAQDNPQIIVFPEADLSLKTLQATIKIAEQKLAYPVLLGNPKSLLTKIKENNGTKILDYIQIHDHSRHNKQFDYYLEQLLILRKHKKLTLKEARIKLSNVNYYATMMLHEEHAHGVVSGATGSTADTIKPALEIIKTKDKFHKVSGYFLMLLKDQVLLFADCAINITPTAQELAQIGIDTANQALKFGINPKIAFLSFSTKQSSLSPETKKIAKATQIAKRLAPQMTIDGEIQVDAALNFTVSQIKSPNSPLKGQANILIFPDLNSGNIAYKLVERLAKAEAIGPILQGLAKPFNDLSRGCSLQDIVNLTAITSIEAQEEIYY